MNVIHSKICNNLKLKTPRYPSGVACIKWDVFIIQREKEQSEGYFLCNIRNKLHKHDMEKN